MKRQRLLVTGASGFLGRHVLALAVERYDVVALVGRRTVPPELASRCSDIVTGDIADEGLTDDLVRDVDLVCHLAAHVPACHDDESEAGVCVRANSLATLRLAERGLESGIARFVYASAGTMYVPTGRAAREDDAVYPSARATYYLASKLLGELYVEHLRIARDLPAFSLRISSIYGPGMPAGSLVAQMLANARAGAPLEVHHGGIPASDLVYVTDVAACLVAALERGEPGVYNVGAGRTWSLAEVAEAVRVVVGSTSKVNVTAPAGAVPASFPAINVDKASRAWGYSPTSLEDGLRRMCAESHP